MKDFALVTGVTPDYTKKLRWCLPTWPMKPQLAGKKLYVFHSGFQNVERELGWITDYFNVQLVEWDMPKAESVREKMLSAFVLGAALVVQEEYFVKLDADTFCTDAQELFHEEDFKHDLFSHRWGYTKPGWWIDKMDAWVQQKRYKGGDADKGRRSHKRIQSIACLHRTAFVEQCAKAAGDRLPVPSHDTYLWYMAEHFKDCTWGKANLKQRGIDHCSRWRGIRENICASECAWNPYLNKELLKNVQVHITNACNIGCNNCDRVCGLAPDNSILDTEAVSRFVSESILCGHRYNRIDIIGGEPMLYGSLWHLYKELQRYKDFHKRVRIRLTTNGTVHKEKIAQIPDWIQVRNSSKDCSNKEYDFETFNVAPCDSGHNGIDAKSCSIPWRCGFALTPHGYFLCGAGYGVARTFGFDIGIQSLQEVTPIALMAQRLRLCERCGHSRSIAKREKGQKTSPTWKQAITNYKQAKPELRRY